MASVAPSLALLNTQLTAKNVALEEELLKARAELRELRKRTAQQEDTIAELTSTVQQLKATLEHLLESRRRPEMVDPNQGLLFADPVAAPSNESTEEQEKPSPTKPAKKPRKPPAPSRRVADESNLRREIVRSELPLDQRRCPKTGVELVEVGVKVSKELDYRRGELVVVEHHQVVYGPAPEVAAERNIEPVLAPAHMVAVEGVTASANLLAWLIYQKYVLHLPLYRLEQVFGELGLRLARTTQSDWVQKVAFALRPVKDEIERQVRAGPVLSFDDTVTECFVVNEVTGRRKLKQARLWVFVNPEVPGVVFRFTTGRGADDLAGILSTPEPPTSGAKPARPLVRSPPEPATRCRPPGRRPRPWLGTGMSAAIDAPDDAAGLVEPDVEPVRPVVAGRRTGGADDADVGVPREGHGPDMGADQRPGPLRVAAPRPARVG